ncbi:hypothetical protein [Gordonia crocea]|uniref:Secreted protein n=1 Tax=Gordonia crocea TaxID=589162 RepID=A0A7I9V2G3_9ACTN|nr:hypothetical protein [Gordonia crocea]GED99382.1 hypothetical protein nbrc107697_34210 [Gordonia crocea]
MPPTTVRLGILAAAALISVSLGSGAASAAPTTKVSVAGNVATITTTLSTPSTFWVCFLRKYRTSTDFQTLSDNKSYSAGNLTVSSPPLADGKYRVGVRCYDPAQQAATDFVSTPTTIYVGPMAGIYRALDGAGSSSLVPSP